PKPDTLTADNIAADFLAVADAVGADNFGYYGYSWLAAAGLQLAVRTERLIGLAMGGFPPLDGPYAEMRAVTAAAHAAASNPKPDTLTAGSIAADGLAVADAVGADNFGYYGYSWLAAAGLQLAVRTERLIGLAMGGFPPLDGPYAEMRAVTAAAHAAASNPKP